MKREGAFHCIVGGNQGIYVPQAFLRCYDWKEWGLDFFDVNIITHGPEHELYWEAWDSILDTAKIQVNNGEKYRLDQIDGDLFAVNEKYEGEEE